MRPQDRPIEASSNSCVSAEDEPDMERSMCPMVCGSKHTAGVCVRVVYLMETALRAVECNICVDSHFRVLITEQMCSGGCVVSFLDTSLHTPRGFWKYNRNNFLRFKKLFFLTFSFPLSLLNFLLPPFFLFTHLQSPQSLERLFSPNESYLIKINIPVTE